MGLLVLLVIAGLILFLIALIYYKTFIWTIEPLIKHFEEKERETKTEGDKDDL